MAKLRHLAHTYHPAAVRLNVVYCRVHGTLRRNGKVIRDLHRVDADRLDLTDGRHVVSEHGGYGVAQHPLIGLRLIAVLQNTADDILYQRADK